MAALAEAFQGYDRSLVGAAAAEDIASRVHTVICAMARAEGQNPDIEAGIHLPVERKGK